LLYTHQYRNHLEWGMSRIAVIGSGISGLSAAWHLSKPDAGHEVTLFEAGNHFGGHANTVDVTIDGITHGVDTGFLVYNERTYPGLIALFDELDVARAPSQMSFSVQSPQGTGRRNIEWSGHSLDTVFAQRSNLLRPRFWSMLRDILRFNRLTTSLAVSGAEAALTQPIGAFLDEHGFGPAFREDYFLPMAACIWSCPTEQMLRFPMATMIRFCHNHGLLQVTDRPQWFTVTGGSREYVRKLVGGLTDARLNTPVTAVARHPQAVTVHTRQGSEVFDAVVMACHSDQALKLLGGHATDPERRLLGAIRYQPNRAVLHTDTRLLPSKRSAWAAWNYERAIQQDMEQSRVCLHYLINALQPLPWQQPVVVSLNPVREPDPATAQIQAVHQVAADVVGGPGVHPDVPASQVRTALRHQRLLHRAAGLKFVAGEQFVLQLEQQDADQEHGPDNREIRAGAGAVAEPHDLARRQEQQQSRQEDDAPRRGQGEEQALEEPPGEEGPALHGPTRLQAQAVLGRDVELLEVGQRGQQGLLPAARTDVIAQVAPILDQGPPEGFRGCASGTCGAHSV